MKTHLKVYLYIFSILILTPSFSQKKIIGHIVNIQGQSVPYANIFNVERTHGVVADSTGFFTYFCAEEMQDTLCISSLGYLQKNVYVNESNNLEVILQESISNLEEFTIRQTATPEIEILGTESKKPDGRHSNCTKNNLEISLFVKNKRNSKISFIDKVVFYVSKTDSYNVPFRVKIYTNKSGLPDELLLHENVIAHPLQPGWVVVSLSQYNIKIPLNGVHIAMEWLYIDMDSPEKVVSDKKCYGQSIGMAKGLNELLACTRINGGVWTPCSFYKLANGDIYNPMIRAVVNSYPSK